MLAPAARADGDEIVRTAGGVSYVSGGVGTESIEQLRALARDFNLKLVFALKSGDFVSGVQVIVADAAGRPLLDTNSEGPWLLAKLPAGRYRISASFGGDAQTRNIAVDAAHLKTVDFRWAPD